jgi:opacity protein-like surface antigen
MVQLKKNTALTIALFLLLTSLKPVIAQVMNSRFDIYAIGGYGIPIGGHYISTSVKSENIVPRILEEKDHYLNYGKGLHLEAGVNFRTMENIKAQISFNYTRNIPSIKDKDENITVSEFNNEDKYSVNLIGFKVLLIPYFNAFDLVELYTGVGIGFFFNKVTIKGNNVVHNRYEGNIKTKPALAFCSKFGADFPLNDMFSLFGEISFDAMSFKAESIQSTRIPDEVTFDKDNSTLLPPPRIPGSNFGINIGIRLMIL